MKRLTGSFVATREDGTEVRLSILTDFVRVRTTEGESEVEGLKELVLLNGGHVNRLGQGRYQVVATGELLTSDAPGAP